jgi:hypothetical protein
MLSNKEEYQKEFSKFKDETEMLINEKNEVNGKNERRS